ncbi:MAG: bifunctional riboflavin kinase/FAD synthetase [Burkholderiales bacterium]|nr:bifunctional riboflavin kinase/FAD synthetase [Burkholderiales bacterium]
MLCHASPRQRGVPPSVQLIRRLPAVADRPVALTIGNFDGVHRGHQAMLVRLAEAAEDLGLEPAVLTFDPHPREFFSRDRAPPRLSSLRGKIDVMRKFGVARVVVARFDRALASLEPDTFVDEVLVRRFDARWVLVGDDFRYGRARAGDLGTLRRHAKTYSVEAMGTIDVAGERVSSSAVRDALAAGDLDRAKRLLGRPYAIGGHVVHGRKLGRTLGFPTANLPLRRTPPLSGIFAVRVHGAGPTRRGVASLGVRPTVESDGRPLLEVYLFDFDEPIYGRRIVVEFHHKLRDEARYADLDTLVRQIRTDASQARAWFDREPATT